MSGVYSLRLSTVTSSFGVTFLRGTRTFGMGSRLLACLPAAVPLPPHQEILLASEPDAVSPDGDLRPDSAAWLSA